MDVPLWGSSPELKHKIFICNLIVSWIWVYAPYMHNTDCIWGKFVHHQLIFPYRELNLHVISSLLWKCICNNRSTTSHGLLWRSSRTSMLLSSFTIFNTTKITNAMLKWRSFLLPFNFQFLSFIIINLQYVLNTYYKKY